MLGAILGGMFRRWLRVRDPQPYNSFGNGSATCVAAYELFRENLKRGM